MLENVKSILNAYVTSYDTLLNQFNEGKAGLSNVFSGHAYTDLLGKLKGQYETERYNRLKLARESLDNEFNNIEGLLKNKVVTGASPQIIAEIQLLKMTKVTSSEMEAYFEKYKNNYVICKALKEICKEQDIQLSESVITLDDQLHELAEVKGLVVEFINTFNGTGGNSYSYKQRLLIKEGDGLLAIHDNNLNQFFKGEAVLTGNVKDIVSVFGNVPTMPTVALVRQYSNR